MLDVTGRRIYTPDHHMFREGVRKFLARAFLPNFQRWEAQGITDRSFWRECGNAGLLCPTVPEAYGGLGLDFTFNAIVAEEMGYHGAVTGTQLQSDVIADYFVNYGSEDQKRTYLPKMVSGECVAGIAMTEPGTGSDLQGVRTSARREGEEYVLSGSKTYISSGQNADVFIVVAKTSPEARGKGISLIIVEADRPGFQRGRNLDKIGLWSSDTSELFFQDVRIPCSNLLGEENEGFGYLMRQLPQERLSITVAAQAAAQRAFDEAVAFTKGRNAFGQPIFNFQNTRFTLADLAAKIQVGWAHLDWAIARHVEGKLTAAEASAAKYWHTEMQWQVVDTALQLHGGAGYMNETTIARLWRDARAQRIYGGTSQIMLEIVGRAL